MKKGRGKMSEIKRESPLVGQVEAVRGANAQGPIGVTLYERPFLGHIALRGDGNDSRFITACAGVLGVEPPVTPNTVAEGRDVIVCWLGPSEWLVLCAADAQQSWLDGLRKALAEVHSAVVDLSGGQTLIAIGGEHAADVLAKGTPLDLHPRAFGAGACARTLIAKSAVFIRMIEPGRAFEVVVRRSFADYLWQWLRDAADEYGCNVASPQSVLQRTGTVGERDVVLQRAAHSV
jgi:sarcosine oxidase subunit gamma